MSDAEIKLEHTPENDLRVARSAKKSARSYRLRTRIVPFLITLATTALALRLGVAMWDTYMQTPWTRDATVRTYVVTLAPEVAGRIIEMPVADDQFVHKGDLLLVVDSIDYKHALQSSEEAVVLAQAAAQNAQQQAERRRKLSDLAVTVEDRQTHEANATAAGAQYRQALVNRDQARVKLERTEIRSPVNGWVTNLLARVGDYATVGRNVLSVVDADSFWVDAYFQETQLPSINEGDLAKIKLMGHRDIVFGEVAGISRGITIANALPEQQGLANVNPIFTWVRLAQRVPVRIRITGVPDNARLVAGLTATVEIVPRSGRSTNGPMLR